MRKSNVEHNNLLRKIIITTNCFEYNFLSKKIIFQHDHQLDLLGWGGGTMILLVTTTINKLSPNMYQSHILIM